MIPPGLHFIYWSVVDMKHGGGQAPRTGFFQTFGKGQLVAKRFLAKDEDVVDVEPEDVDR